MSNMSYCRMENTYLDLRDCYENMEEVSSESEKEYRKKLVSLCQDIVNNFGDEYGDN